MFSVGDFVIDFAIGDGKVVSTVERFGNLRCVIVNFERGTTHAYFLNGRREPDDLRPSLYPVGTVFSVDVAPEEGRTLFCINGSDFKKGDLVLVRDYFSEPWILTSFQHYDPFDKLFPYFTYQNMHKQCIPFYGNEWAAGRITDEDGKIVVTI